MITAPLPLRIVVAIFICCSRKASTDALCNNPKAHQLRLQQSRSHCHGYGVINRHSSCRDVHYLTLALHGHHDHGAQSSGSLATAADEDLSSGEAACSTTTANANNNNHHHDNNNAKRRKFLSTLTLPIAAALLISQQATPTMANAVVDNPLNLKGTFWETGRLYEKSSAAADDPLPPSSAEDFLAVLENAVEALRSPQLVRAIEEGRYGAASRSLRGGLISESKLRIAANALMDEMPEDDEAAYTYRSREAFRVFLRCLDVLDAEVESASRPSFGGDVGGGLGGGGGDPRMKILTRLGEVEDSMKVVVKTIRSGF